MIGVLDLAIEALKMAESSLLANRDYKTLMVVSDALEKLMVLRNEAHMNAVTHFHRSGLFK